MEVRTFLFSSCSLPVCALFVLRVDKVSGQSRGVGFVHFSSYKDATAAIKSTDGTIPDGCTQALSVKVIMRCPSADWLFHSKGGIYSLPRLKRRP